MASHLLLQIIYPNGEVVRLPGGGNPPFKGDSLHPPSMEANLVELIVDAVRAGNTLGFSTRARDEQNITTALQKFKDLTLKVMV